MVPKETDGFLRTMAPKEIRAEAPEKQSQLSYIARPFRESSNCANIIFVIFPFNYTLPIWHPKRSYFQRSPSEVMPKTQSICNKPFCTVHLFNVIRKRSAY